MRTPANKAIRCEDVKNSTQLSRGEVFELSQGSNIWRLRWGRLLG